MWLLVGRWHKDRRRGVRKAFYGAFYDAEFGDQGREQRLTESVNHAILHTDVK